MAEPTTQYVVASKDCKNPEAAFKIINYLIANEQTWERQISIRCTMHMTMRMRSRHLMKC